MITGSKHRAFIALGSNLQQPELQISTALDELATLPHTTAIKTSSLYKTAPVGYDNQPDFVNAVAEVETLLSAHELLDALLSLENTHGRVRPFPNAPRVLDLDLLLFDDVVMQTSTLTLPHPRMHLRGFVMQPLAEIAPDVIIPNIGKVSDILVSCLSQHIENQSVEKINHPDKKHA